jgi:hypothetical protein
MRTLALTILLCATVMLASAQDKVTEPSTGKSFPATVKFTYNGTEYSLQLTGVAVRKKLVFKVYGMAHYLQEPVGINKQNAFPSILADGKAKQIIMDFARDVDAEKIRETYKESFKENSSAEDFAKLQPLIDQFLGAFAKGARENDQFVLRWLPGGIVVAIAQGEEKPAIHSELFARTLWTIWFGEDSVVDRDDLVAKAAGK